MSNAIEKAQPSALATLLSDPERLKDYPIETVERLFELDKQVRAEASRREFNVAFNALQSELTPVRKKGRNDQTRSAYARAEDVNAMLQPIIVKNGFSLSVDTEDCPIPSFLRFVMTIRHIGGHNERHVIDAPIDDKGPKGAPVKTLLHGTGSSLTYCDRILKCSVFDIQLVADDDGNAGAGIGIGAEKISEEEALDVEASLESVNGNKAKLLAIYGIERISDLPKFQLKAVHQMLAEKGRR